MRYCASCGRPVPDHPSNRVGKTLHRFCPIQPAEDQEEDKPERWVYDPGQVK